MSKDRALDDLRRACSQMGEIFSHFERQDCEMVERIQATDHQIAAVRPCGWAIYVSPEGEGEPHAGINADRVELIPIYRDDEEVSIFADYREAKLVAKLAKAILGFTAYSIVERTLAGYATSF